MTRMRGSWFRAVPVPAVWLTLASFRSSTLALTAVVALTPLASAQVADVLPGDQPGPYPHWITAPSDLGWDERLTRSHPELTAADMADIEGEPRRRRMADPADVEGIFRYRLVGEHRSSKTGHSISFSNDVDCDGFAEVIIGAPLVVGAGGNQFNDPKLGAVYVVSMADVEAADAADGTADGVIDLGLVAAQPRSWKLLGEGRHLVGTSVASGGDINGDGCSELLIGARAYGYFTGSAYLVSASDLPAADAADGAADGVVDIRRIADQPDSWELTGEASRDNAGRTVIFAGDVNGDGRSDLLIGALFHGNDDRGAAYLLSGAALASADAEDGAADGRIALASVAAQPDSWKLLGENAKVFAGNKLAAANLDSDGRSDLIVAALFEFSTRGAVYLIAASDLPAMDSADGQSDGVIDLGNVAGGRASWKLVGDIEGQYIGREVAAGDVDGDGVDNVVIATSNETDSGRPAEVFVISVSGLPSADAADGARDGVATLDRALEQDGSFKLVGENRLYISSDADIDGDGLDDLLVGDIDFREGSRCLPGGGSRTNGAVYLISGASLRGADASDGAEDSVIDLDRVSSQDGSWQFIGGPTDRLGGALAAGDLDGDGNNDLILAPWINHTPYHDCGSSRDAGYVFLMSGAHLPAADAVDGAADGKIHLAALGVPVDALETPIVFTQFDDSVIVARVPEFLEYNQLDDDKLIKTFLRHYEDVFDYLIIVTDLPPNSPQYDYAGIYVDLRNSVVGTGKRVSVRGASVRRAAEGMDSSDLFRPFQFLSDATARDHARLGQLHHSCGAAALGVQQCERRARRFRSGAADPARRRSLHGRQLQPSGEPCSSLQRDRALPGWLHSPDGSARDLGRNGRRVVGRQRRVRPSSIHRVGDRDLVDPANSCRTRCADAELGRLAEGLPGGHDIDRGRFGGGVRQGRGAERGVARILSPGP